METISDEYRDSFETDAFANFATIISDGTPHVTVIRPNSVITGG